MSVVSVEKLVECECNLGLRLRYWNPKMKDYISGKERGRYMFDPNMISEFLGNAYGYILDLVKAGADIMFVGVKNKLTSGIIKEAASRVEALYLTKRWLGGLLTNFKTISLNIKKLNELTELLENPELQEGYTKKEIIQFSKQKDKLEKFYGGVKNLQRLPNLLVVFNPVEDAAAVQEAKKVGIPVIALSNINTDPDQVDFVIPGNNKSMKSVYLIANLLCDAIAEIQGKDTVVAHKSDAEIIIPEEYQSRPITSERGAVSFI
ncbi:30S ribosomal protein S2 [Mycoplasma haemofelis Ohio2]|uniref:Small ribosomal subunit protein uS2 n=1 Tax=Mycoplasma haemofelis (strain Ohio2) TaxID=859194 RepID=F6FH27_MYCHI|nr:30S ribosomal protein S2 [Mycoplasma haemofelis Ohio2]